MVALIAALAWFKRLYPDWLGLGPGVIGPVLAAETAIFAWTFYAFNDKLGTGDLCDGCREGRVDIFFYVAAVVILATQFAAMCLWELPEPAVAPARDEREPPSAPKISLSKAEVARTWTFWGYFWVYFVTLLPGFGLKLMSSPVVYWRWANIINRGDAAAATWIVRGDASRRRRGRDADIPWRRVPAATRTFDQRPARLSGISLTASVMRDPPHSLVSILLGMALDASSLQCSVANALTGRERSTKFTRSSQPSSSSYPRPQSTVSLPIDGRRRCPSALWSSRKASCSAGSRV